MDIEQTIFFKEKWIWSKFLRYLTYKLETNKVLKINIPSEFAFKESFYGSQKSRKNVTLATWGVFNARIQFSRAVCIDSPNYSVLNFLIIPNTKYNVPFLGIDFVSLPTYYLIVLDFQPSLNINQQFDKELLNRMIKIKDHCHSIIPKAEAMNIAVQKFFSPGMIWSKLPKEVASEIMIKDQLYYSFKEYVDLYFEIIFSSNEVDKNVQKKIIKGQNDYLTYRKEKDPARPMLSNLFGKDFTESFINEFLFSLL